ncbi:uncharacterized protein LOC115325526 [Ixodes scapularis]|uniref:uncharacterized protein LOC115325526 n=1 Tax=Ixodes scapularis TaxID=6945 RepID=UPI001A9E2353|nr:uncharacterized protein LOC115325526 [Ixodes scapularis]
MYKLIVLLVFSVAVCAEVTTDAAEPSNTTIQTLKPKGFERTMSDVVASLVSRVIGEVMISKSDVAKKGGSVHDRVDDAFSETGTTLKHMGRLVSKVGGAIKVAGRWLFQRYGILGPRFGIGTFKKAKAVQWVLNISTLGNNTLQARVAKLTAKTISAFSARGFSRKGHVAFEKLGDIVGSAGDVLEDVAQRLAGDSLLPATKLTQSDIDFVSAVNQIIKDTK